jgi:hypothetical protein
VGPEHVAIDEFLRDLGLANARAIEDVRRVLEDAGLTRPGKSYLHRSKIERAKGAIDAAVLRTCAACGSAADPADGRKAVLVQPLSCSVCRGSRIRSTATRLRGELLRSGLTRILIVGGSPEGQAHLQAELGGPGVSIQVVDGTRAPGSDRARRLRNGADIVVIWGGTPLDHPVSERFIDRADRSRTVVVPRGGPQSVLRALSDHVRRRS